MPSPTQLLDRLIATTDASERPGFGAVCQHLFDARYTGTVLVYFRNGVPQEVQIPQPLKLKLSSSS